MTNRIKFKRLGKFECIMEVTTYKINDNYNGIGLTYEKYRNDNIADMMFTQCIVTLQLWIIDFGLAINVYNKKGDKKNE